MITLGRITIAGIGQIAVASRHIGLFPKNPPSCADGISQDGDCPWTPRASATDPGAAGGAGSAGLARQSVSTRKTIIACCSAATAAAVEKSEPASA